MNKKCQKFRESFGKLVKIYLSFEKKKLKTMNKFDKNRLKVQNTDQESSKNVEK